MKNLLPQAPISSAGHKIADSSRRQFIKHSGLAVAATSMLSSPAAQAMMSGTPGKASSSRLAANTIGYTGQRQDPVTGLYHLGNGYRVYNPGLMRFHAADSMSPFGRGGINRYAYVLGDPINSRDPSGHFLISLIVGAIVGAVVGAAMSATVEGISAAAQGRKFDWKQVAIGAAIGFISGGFGAAAVGARTGVQVGLAVADAVVSGAADFGLQVAAGSSVEDAGANAGIGAAIGLVTFGAGKALGAGAKSLKRAKVSPGVASRSSGSGPRYGNIRQSVQKQKISQPILYMRRSMGTNWHMESLPNNSFFHGSDTAITGHNLTLPLGKIARRNSTSNVYIYSGVHGYANGGNWHRNIANRKFKLNERAFYRSDVSDYKDYFKKQGINRKIKIIDIRSARLRKFMNSNARAGHHIHAYCFSRNDNAMLDTFNLRSVVSFYS